MLNLIMKIQEVLNEIKLIGNSAFGLKIVNQFILDLAHDGLLVGDLDTSSWKMIKLESAMGDCRNGLTYKNNPDSGGLPISRIETISDGRINFSRVGYSDLTEESHFNFLIKEGNILFSHINSIEQLGKVAIYESGMNPLLHGMNLLRITPSKDYSPKFLFYMFRTSQVRSQVVKKAKQSINQASINMKELRSIDLPMPPLDHQLRIVNCLDAFLSICGELEVAINERNVEGIAFRKSAVDSISTAQTSEELQTAWERISSNWEVIAGTTESIESLRELILDVLFKPKKIDEWEIRSFGDLLTISNGDRSKNYPSKEFRVSAGIPFVNAGHLKDGQIDLSEMDYISREKYESLSGGKFQDGDILFCLRGSLGKSALVKNFGEGTIASSLAIFRVGVEIDAEYLFWFLQSGMARLQIKRFDNGTAQPNLAAKSVLKFEIPLPKLSEQKSIVNKVAELMKICDELQQKLIQKEEVADKFARSVVSVSA
jgi:type I restriction enzyme S subunit